MDTTATRLFLDALSFAAERHRFQKRKDEHATPYVNHVIDVAHLLTEAGETDAGLLAAALLHDTIEDTNTTEEELLARFGQRITALVVEMTDDKSLAKDKRKELQILHAAERSMDARKLKLADKTCNVRDMLDHPPHKWSEQRKVEYLSWAKQVVDEIRGTNAFLELRFDEAYEEGMQHLYHSRLQHS